MKKINDFQKKIKNLCTKKKDIKIPGYDQENFRYGVANSKLESDLFYTIFGRLMHALSEKEFNIDLVSVYDATIVSENRNRIGEEIYQHMLSYQHEFIMNLKNKLSFDLLVEYLRYFNYYSDCDAIVSFYQKSIVEQFWGFLLRIEMIISRDKSVYIENSKLSLIDDHAKYVLDNLGEITQDYLKSIEYSGRFYFSESNFYEKMQLLRVKELNQNKRFTEDEFLKIHKEETESLHFQKDQMKGEFPEALKEKLFDLEIKYKKIAQDSKENKKLIKESYKSLKILNLIDSSLSQFDNFIRNKKGVIHWTKNKNELLFFIHMLNQATNCVGENHIYKWMCEHFYLEGQEIEYRLGLRNDYDKYVKNPPGKNRQELISKAVGGLGDLKWNYKVLDK